MTTDFWALYNEARKEVEKETTALVLEKYVAKLEARIEELEQDLENVRTSAGLSDDDELPF